VPVRRETDRHRRAHIECTLGRLIGDCQQAAGAFFGGAGDRLTELSLRPLIEMVLTVANDVTITIVFWAGAFSAELRKTARVTL
jgi:hypothetical protein